MPMAVSSVVAACCRVFSESGRPSRLFRQIAVTTAAAQVQQADDLVRRTAVPAVMRLAMKTSCTRPIGRPKQLLANA